MARPIGPDMRARILNGGTTLRRATVHHATHSTYVMGCRCDPCRDAEAAYSRARYAARRQLAESR